jgi:Uma2 family endonuclease
MPLDMTFVSERTVTQEEFAAWVAARRDDDARYELLGGRIVMTPSSAWPEGEGELEVGRLLGNHVRAGRLGRVFGSSQGFELSTGDTVAADVAFVSQSRWDAGPPPVPGKFLRVIPVLMVELTTPDGRTRDQVEKRQIYAAAGVLEYWVVDLRRREVTLFTTVAEGRFDGGRTLGADDTLTPTVLQGFAVRVSDLLIA